MHRRQLRNTKRDKDISESQVTRAQQNGRMTSNLRRWIKNGAPVKDDLDEDSYTVLK